MVQRHTHFMFEARLCVPNGRRSPVREGFTLFDVLWPLSLVAVAAAVFAIVEHWWGAAVAWPAAFVAAWGVLAMAISFYVSAYCWRQKKQRELDENYQWVYRVTCVPDDDRTAIIADGAAIQIGDTIGNNRRPIIV